VETTNDVCSDVNPIGSLAMHWYSDFSINRCITCISYVEDKVSPDISSHQTIFYHVLFTLCPWLIIL